MKSLASCLLIIGDISSSWDGRGGEKYNLLHHRTINSSFFSGASGFGLVCEFYVCLSFFQRENQGGRVRGREEDLRFNLRTRWKANTDVRSEK